MKPYIHAKNSVRRYGGKIEDYMAIHDFFDSTKSAWADIRHRAILHSSFGIYLVEKVFGTTITNSDGKQVSVRDIGEDHVVEDCGQIPTIEKWLKNLPVEDWMLSKGQGNFIKRTLIPLEQILID
jgi:hypothetical protein